MLQVLAHSMIAIAARQHSGKDKERVTILADSTSNTSLELDVGHQVTHAIARPPALLEAVPWVGTSLGEVFSRHA